MRSFGVVACPWMKRSLEFSLTPRKGTSLPPAFDPLVLGQRIRYHRRRRGMTLDDLGAQVGRPAPYLSLVENGRREPRLSQVAEIAAALDVTVADLLDPEPPTQRAALEV